MYVSNVVYYAAGAKKLVLTITGASNLVLAVGNVASNACNVADFAINRPGSTGAALGGTTTCDVIANNKISLVLANDANVQNGDTVRFGVTSKSAPSRFETHVLDDVTTTAVVGAMYISSAVYYGDYADGERKLVITVAGSTLVTNGACRKEDFALSGGMFSATAATGCTIDSGTQMTLALGKGSTIASSSSK